MSKNKMQLIFIAVIIIIVAVILLAYKPWNFNNSDKNLFDRRQSMEIKKERDTLFFYSFPIAFLTLLKIDFFPPEIESNSLISSFCLSLIFLGISMLTFTYKSPLPLP